MEVSEAEQLINAMIKEDENYTIKDYLEYRAEYLSISKTVIDKHDNLMLSMGIKEF